MDRTTMDIVTAFTAVLLLAPMSAPKAAEKQGPVKVFILAGQSNMEGQAVADLDAKDYNHGKGTLVQLMRDPAKAPLLGHFRDEQGRWTVRDDVWVRYRREQGPLLRGRLTMGFSVYGDAPARECSISSRPDSRPTVKNARRLRRRRCWIRKSASLPHIPMACTATSASATSRCRRSRHTVRAWASTPRSGRWWISRWPIFRSACPARGSRPTTPTTRTSRWRREGTLARTWRERGPTWSSVFQTVEGGLGYWAGNHFRYGPPKFSMNATPQCYDYEVGSPGWSFFYSNEALPDNRLGIAQLSNRLLIPPDALPFQGNPNGEFLGYTWMALPFTDRHDRATRPPATRVGPASSARRISRARSLTTFPKPGARSASCSTDPFLYGRGLDARPGIMGGGAMEINTVPRFDAKDAQGTVYSKLPQLQFPVDAEGRALLVQDVTYYSKAALYDAFKAWRNGGPACSGRFDEKGAWKPKLTTHTTRYDQAGKKITGVDRVFDTKIFEGNVWGLQWFASDVSPKGSFPQYFKHVGEQRVAVAAADVPAETGLLTQEFQLAQAGQALHVAGHRRLEPAGPEARPVHGQARRRFGGDLLVVPLCRSAVVPAIRTGARRRRRSCRRLWRSSTRPGRSTATTCPRPRRGTLVCARSGLLVTPPDGLDVATCPS